MPASSPPTVVMFSAPGSLKGADPLLRRAGVRLVRLASLETQAVDPTTWLGRLTRTPAPDTVVVTSRRAVGVGVRPWRRASGPFPATLEFWAVGPGTAQALRQAGIRRIRRPRTVGAMAVARSLGQGPPRRIVYFRSDLAGPHLARTLEGQHHRVVDLVVYRLRAPARLAPRAHRELSAADLLVVTSPSGLTNLRRRLDRRTFAQLSRTTPLVVLGERSRRAAEELGFRRTSVAPSTAPQRFTHYLLRELRNART
jgi:uroporphyrinogen-III synthase